MNFMIYKAELVGKLKDGREVYGVAAPLDEQLQAFAEVGAEYITPDDVALIRNEKLSTRYSRTSMAVVARKAEKTILMRESPLMNPAMAVLAVRTNRAGRYQEISGLYDLAREIAEADSTKEPEDMRAIMLSKKGDYRITAQHPETRFTLKAQTTPYFDNFVKGSSKEGSIPVWDLQTDSKDSVGYLWFNEPEVGSDLYLRLRGLYSGSWAFGVKEKTADIIPENKKS